MMSIFRLIVVWLFFLFSALLSITKTKAEVSKTVELLKNIFPNDQVIDKFEVARRKYKINPNYYNKDYKLLSAQVIVKLNVFEMDGMERIKSIERKAMEENKSLSVRPKAITDREEYERIIHQLKCVKSLKELF